MPLNPSVSMHECSILTQSICISEPIFDYFKISNLLDKVKLLFINSTNIRNISQKL